MQYDRRMSIDRDGFLSPDIAEIRDRCRSQHRDSFEMITEINRVAQAVLPGFSTLQSTDKNSIACQLFIRALQSLQAAVLTAEIGLMSEAYTLIRSGLESVFYLGATIRTDDIKLKLMRDQVKRVRTVMEGFKRAIPDGDKYVNQDAFEEMLRSALPEGVDPATVSIKTFADQAGLTVLYDGIYRQLSLAHAHPSLISLASIRHVGDDHKTQGVQWGPERGDPDEIKNVLSLTFGVMFNLLTQWARLAFQNDQPATALQQRLIQIGEKYQPALGYPWSGRPD
jgi:hypothetical protein